MIITHSLSSLSERNYCKLHVNNSRDDVTMPLKIEKNALSLSVERRETPQKNLQHSLFFSQLSPSESSMESDVFEDLLGLVWK